MRKLALLLFLVFATVQLAPAVMALFSQTTTVFIADEEKGEEKGNSSDNKEKKDYTDLLSQSANLSNKIRTAFHLTEKIHPSPCMEKLSPPPNFC